MGREVRRVPANWSHPEGKWGFKPLYPGSWYAEAKERWLLVLKVRGLQAALDEGGRPPDASDYMPEWSETEADHLMMYENTTEGTPISPAFKTPEELARWLTDNNASAFGDMGATYEQWLAMARRGWAPSAVVQDGKFMSGVEAATK